MGYFRSNFRLLGSVTMDQPNGALHRNKHGDNNANRADNGISLNPFIMGLNAIQNDIFHINNSNTTTQNTTTTNANTAVHNTLSAHFISPSYIKPPSNGKTLNNDQTGTASLNNMTPPSNGPSSIHTSGASTLSFAETTARNNPGIINRSTNITTNRIVISSIQGECGMDSPLPRINDASFRHKWNNRQLSINCAVLFEALKDVRHIEYLEALCSIIDPSQIISIGNAGDGKISVVFINTSVTDRVLLNGFTVQNQFIQPTPFMSRPIRVVLSKIPAWVPDEPILRFFRQFGKITSNLRPLPINCNKIEKFTNIISNFREFYINLDKDKKLPGHIQVVDGEDTFNIDIATEQKCYICKESGHLARLCPKKLVEQQVTVNKNHSKEFPELLGVLQQQQKRLQQPAQNRLEQQQADLQQPQQPQQINAFAEIHKEPTFKTPNEPIMTKTSTKRHGSPTSLTESPTTKMAALDSEIESDTMSMDSSSGTDDIAEEPTNKDEILVNLSIKDTIQLLQDTYRKKNPKKILDVISKYVEVPTDCLPDLNQFRKTTTSQAKIAQIDKLKKFVEELV